MTVTEISPRQRQETLYDVQTHTIHRVGITFQKIPQVNEYLKGLIDSEWFGEKWPEFYWAKAEKVRGTWSTATHSDFAEDGHTVGGYLNLAGLNQSTVLHELAHLLGPKDSGHNWLYAETLLTLVRHEMGFIAWADFYNALKATPEYSPIRKGI